MTTETLQGTYEITHLQPTDPWTKVIETRQGIPGLTCAGLRTETAAFAVECSAADGLTAGRGTDSVVLGALHGTTPGVLAFKSRLDGDASRGESGWSPLGERCGDRATDAACHLPERPRDSAVV
ncbi:hypothetical protein SKAU_G00020980 [Synaphobranchus kaupii]|uniref:Uncharacterized protein n=1 Tax=Synaphobranchus kaupii TaxID=118154 RepID=A0A9Q1GBU6_SYNKA|nr:hypothetical protein SKAU_G00020980 [Synaphobranchus kaupii]